MEESTREEREATSSPKRRGRVKEEKVKRRSSVDWAKEDAQLRKPSDHSSVKAGSREQWWAWRNRLRKHPPGQLKRNEVAEQQRR